MMLYPRKNNNKVKESKELSIQMSLSGLSFCILNATSNTIIYLKSFSLNGKKTPFQLLDKLQLLFKEETVFNQEFNKVTIIYENELATLVPKALFKEELVADYLKFNSKILKTDFISYDHIDSLKAVNVYIPYMNINNFIYERFGSFTYKHFSTLLIEKLAAIEPSKTTQNIYLNICNLHFEILFFRNRELLFYNTFDYNSKEDFIYYLLFTIEQLNLNPETLELTFLGAINETDPLYEVTYKYIRHIGFMSRLEQYKFEEPLEYPHSNFTLLNSF